MNQSFVMQTAGIIYLWQQYSKHALLNTAICVTKNGGSASG